MGNAHLVRSPITGTARRLSSRRFAHRWALRALYDRYSRRLHQFFVRRGAGRSRGRARNSQPAVPGRALDRPSGWVNRTATFRSVKVEHDHHGLIGRGL
jgi:hypothetical protein